MGGSKFGNSREKMAKASPKKDAWDWIREVQRKELGLELSTKPRATDLKTVQPDNTAESQRKLSTALLKLLRLGIQQHSARELQDVVEQLRDLHLHLSFPSSFYFPLMLL